MSKLSNYLRARALAAQLAAANREVRERWLVVELAQGLGGLPPEGAEERLVAAVSLVETLTLELAAAS